MLSIHQTSSKLIVDWRDFSIAAGETTRFIQPSASAAALNRVIGANPSRIFGNLEANGKVYLVNQNGILVGRGGAIKTRSFVGSTLEVSDASFLSSAKLTLAGNSAASVVNEGSIEAIGGDVFLVGRSVENSGSIRASAGTAGLAAGDEVVIVPAGRERLSVIAGSPNGSPTGKGVNNVGSIEAVSAELKAAGGNIYALAINNGGIVRATGVRREGGRVVLTSDGGNIENSGTIVANNADGSGGSISLAGGHHGANPATVINSGIIEARGEASGSVGGEVRLTGDYVGLFGASVVDVSGHAGGGTVLVGGDYQGANPGVQNASRTFVDRDSRIHADAFDVGNGGRVIVWANEVNQFLGRISARGGEQGGNGGFAEVSGKLSLSYRGLADLTAPYGRVGELLLDPLTLAIIGGSRPGGDVVPFGSPDGTIGTTAADTDVYETEIETQSATANIILRAQNTITTSGDFADDVVTLAAGANLTLETRNNNTTDSSGSIDLTASTDGVNLEFKTQGSGTITINGSTAGDNTANITVGKLTTAGGDVSITTGNGSISIANVVNAGSGLITLDATAGASQTSGSALIADELELLGAGTFNLNDPLNSVSALAADVQGSLTYVNAGSLTLGGTAGGTQRVRSGDNPIDISTVNGPLTVIEGSATGDTDVNAGTSTLTLQAGSTGGADNLLHLNGGEIGATTEIVLIGDQMTFDTGGGALTIDAGSGRVTLRPAEADTLIDLGGADAGNTLGITDTELGFITAGVVQIGSASAGALSVTAAITAPGGFDTLSLVNNAAITTSGGSIAVANLRVDSPGPVTLSGANDVDTLAASTSGATFSFTDTDDLAVGSVDGVTGINAANSTVSLTVGTSVANNGSLAFDAASTVGTLTVSADGPITDTAAVTIQNGANFTTTVDGADITLDLLDLTGGALTLNTTDSTGPKDANATIVNTVAVDLGASTVHGALNVTATAGDITQTAGVTAHGAATFTVAGGQSILLGNSGNTFNGTVSFASSGGGNINNVTIRDTTAFNLLALALDGALNVTAGGDITDGGTLTVAGMTTLSAGGNNITLDDAASTFGTLFLTGNNVAITENAATDLGASVIGGTLTINNTAGGITDSGPLSVSGATTLDAGANDITLDELLSTFGTLLLTGNNVSVRENAATVLGASTIAGNLTINNTFGGITDTGNIDVTGDSFFTAPAGQSIVLDSAGNDFGGTVTFTGGGGNLNNVTVVDTTAFDLAALTLAGALNVTAGGDITDSGTLTVAGTTTLDSGGSNITLDDPSSTFGTLLLTGNNVAVTENAVTDLGASTIAGTLTINNTAGGITDSGTLAVTGTTTLNAGANDITLDQAASTFGTLLLTGNDVAVTENAVTDLGASTITGTLTINNTAGGITDSGTLMVTGDTTLSAGANDITLDQAGSTFGTLLLTGNDVAVTENAATDLGASTITGTLTINNTAGGITDSGTLTVTGDTTLNAGGNDITLDQAASTFGTLLLTGNDVAITENAATDLGASSVAGDLTINSTGNITDSGTLTVVGDARFVTRNTSTPGNITLDAPFSTFGTVTARTLNTAGSANVAGTINIFENNDMAVDVVDTLGSVTLTSAGAITDGNAAGTVNVTASALSATAATGVSLDTDITTLTLAQVTGLGNINIADANALVVVDATAATGSIEIRAGTGATSDLTVANVTASGNIILTAGRSVLDDGTTAANITSSGGTTQVIAGGGNIGSVANPLDIDSPGGTVTLSASSGAVHVNTVSAGDVIFNAGSAFTQGGQTYNLDYDTDLTVRANGDIDGTATLVVPGTLTLSTAGTIGGAADTPMLIDAGTLNADAGSTISLSDANDLTLGSISSGDEMVIQADDTLLFNNATMLDAGANNVILVGKGSPGIDVEGSPTINSRFLIYGLSALFTSPPVVDLGTTFAINGPTGIVADRLDSPRTFSPLNTDPFNNDGLNYFVFVLTDQPLTDPSLFIDIPVEVFQPVSIVFGEYDPTKFGEADDISWISSSEVYETERKAGKSRKSLPAQVNRTPYVSKTP